MKGRKIGKALASAYIEYAPKLGYRASVFNLVYKSEYRIITPTSPLIRTANVASLAIWKSLGFQQVGCIPNAGRLKSGPNGEEQYVDAYVIHKSFV